MVTLKDFLDAYYTGEPEPIAMMHLEEFLRDLDLLGAFNGGVWGPDEILNNISKLK